MDKQLLSYRYLLFVMLLCCFTLAAVYYYFGANNLVDASSGYFAKPQNFQPAPLVVTRYNSGKRINYTVGMRMSYDYPNASLYHPKNNRTIPHRYFELNQPTVNVLDLLYDLKFDPQNNTDFNWETLPMVIGASSNHYRESLVAVEAHHKMFPNSTMYYYDLGLKKKQAEAVKKMCRVIYRKLDFKLYNDHVKNLHNYAFKAIVWHDMLLRETRFLWMDASVRLKKCFLGVLQGVSTKLERSGVVMLHRSPLSAYSCTAPSLYEYLSANVTKLMTMATYGGGLVLFQRNQQMIDDVMRWLLICSLEKSCVQPKGSRLSCGGKIPRNKPPDFVTPYKKCHRYDMSILSIVQANSYDYEMDRYTIPEVDPCLKVRRGHRAKVNIPTCT